ncbi:hypothetical protein AAG906_013130 [Vitis piasezkii]
MGFNSLTVVENLIEAAKQLHGDTERGDSTVCVAMLRMTNEDNDTALHEATPSLSMVLIMKATLLFTWLLIGDSETWCR